MTQCDICGTKCKEEMIVIENESDVTRCYDCLFSMNYDDAKTLNGAYGYDLDKYIEISSKHHSTVYDVPCFRLHDQTGCYVCMTLFDIPFKRPEKMNTTNITNTNMTNTNMTNTNTNMTNTNTNMTSKPNENNMDNINIVTECYNGDEIELNV